jgi:hypothetical protein
MKGKIFDIKRRFKGLVTVVIDIPEDQYENLDPRQEVEITQ